MPELSNAQLTTEVSNLVSAFNDLAAAINNLAPKTMVDQLELINQNSHEEILVALTAVQTDLTTLTTKLNSSLELLNRVATRVGLGPAITPLEL